MLLYKIPVKRAIAVIAAVMDGPESVEPGTQGWDGEAAATGRDGDATLREAYMRILYLHTVLGYGFESTGLL